MFDIQNYGSFIAAIMIFRRYLVLAPLPSSKPPHAMGMLQV